MVAACQCRKPGKSIEARPYPQFLHRRAYRSREEHARRPAHREDGHDPEARDEGADARHARPRTRARHHHQAQRRAHDVQRARWPRVRAESHRHAGTRRLHVRSVALARRVRGRHPRGGRVAGDPGANALESLPRARRGTRDHPDPQQDRPARRRARAPQAGTARSHWRELRRHPARERERRPRHRRTARAHRGRGAAAAGRSRTRRCARSSSTRSTTATVAPSRACAWWMASSNPE